MSFYFNSLSSVQDVYKESCHGYTMMFYNMPQNFSVLQLNTLQKFPLCVIKIVLFHDFLLQNVGGKFETF